MQPEQFQRKLRITYEPYAKGQGSNQIRCRFIQVGRGLELAAHHSLDSICDIRPAEDILYVWSGATAQSANLNSIPVTERKL